jgi:hypothetical protein
MVFDMGMGDVNLRWGVVGGNKPYLRHPPSSIFSSEN